MTNEDPRDNTRIPRRRGYVQDLLGDYRRGNVKCQRQGGVSFKVSRDKLEQKVLYHQGFRRTVPGRIRCPCVMRRHILSAQHLIIVPQTIDQ